MYRFRRILIAAFVLIYAAQVVGARSMHLWQCSSCDDSRCRWQELESPDTTKQRDTRCGCSFHPESGDSEESPNEDDHHDSSTCRVCQVLGQAEETAIEFAVVASLRLSPESGQPPVTAILLVAHLAHLLGWNLLSTGWWPSYLASPITWAGYVVAFVTLCVFNRIETAYACEPTERFSGHGHFARNASL